jgi:hypothetical protein
MDTDELMGSSDEQNLARMLHDALREADMCAGYALDAQTAGNERLAGFFRDVHKTYTSVAERAEEILGDEDKEQPPTGVRSNSMPLEGDPGDVSPDQSG